MRGGSPTAADRGVAGMPSDRPSGGLRRRAGHLPGRGVAGGFLRPAAGQLVPGIALSAAALVGIAAVVANCPRAINAHPGAVPTDCATVTTDPASPRGTAGSPCPIRRQGALRSRSVRQRNHCPLSRWRHWNPVAVQPARRPSRATGHRHCAAQEGVRMPGRLHDSQRAGRISAGLRRRGR